MVTSQANDESVVSTAKRFPGFRDHDTGPREDRG